jgi:hypothetical protein
LVAALASQLPQGPRQAGAPGVDQAAAPAAIDEAQLAEVTQRLRKLLEDMDSDASDWIKNHAALLATAFPHHLQALSDALESFDFDIATEQLDAAISSRALPLTPTPEGTTP